MRTPDYLKDPSFEGHLYGDLKYDESSKTFTLTGEPILTEFAKRMFPGAKVRRNVPLETIDNVTKFGTSLTFYRSRREISDLNWLMMRFPVRVHCEERLSEFRNSAIEQWNKRADGTDLIRTTPPADFLGKLYPFQETAVTYMVTNQRCILADGMGLGKTWSGLGAIATAGQYPCLIVVETHVQRQWQRVIGQLFDLPGKFERGLFDSEFDVACRRGEALAPILRSRKPYDIPKTPFTIIHYGLLQYWEEKLLSFGYRTIISDEVQSFRHDDTKKYSVFSLLSGQADNVWGLSGTPVYGYGAEIWAVLNAIDFHCLGSRDAFAREWCTGYGERIVTDPAALNGFLMREGFMLRRRASDEEVAIDLPPIIRRVQDVEHDLDVYEDLITAARGKAMGYNSLAPRERWNTAGEIERETRKAAGVSKAPYIAEVVASLIEAGEKPLVFAWHHDVHDILRERLKQYSPAVFTGRETEKQKDKALKHFIDGSAGYAQLSLRSAAGLDGLQGRATMAVNAELDWSPAIHSQCETRIGRMGVNETLKEIPSLYCVSRSGYDEIMLDVLGVKTGQFVGIMGDEPESHEETRQNENRALRRLRRLIDNLTENNSETGEVSGVRT